MGRSLDVVARGLYASGFPAQQSPIARIGRAKMG
jgi:hypothetical protein